MNESAGFDSYWEAKYQAGHSQRYPWDVVVTFVFRNAPRGVPRHQVTILEVGCGTGGNLWFAAREGFRVAGLEGSHAAVAAATARFAEERLTADIRVGDYTLPLPWPDDEFDLVIDRGSLTCCDDEGMAAALKEIRRVLKPGGRALINPFADTHSSRTTGETLANGLTVNMRGGTLAGIAAIRFYSIAEFERLLAGGHWILRSLQRLEITELLEPQTGVHAELRVILEKPAR